jgi:hypothetical protein
MRTAGVITTFLLATSVSSLPQSNDRLFTGEIMDSPCAAMGTHDRMMKGLEAKDAKDCSQKCVRMVGKYVLYDPANKATYSNRRSAEVGCVCRAESNRERNL